ncbi:Tripartite-type tricarboxylate transporter, receptor component TctC [Polaromonas sp. YR568]|uniref:tripartite tricarboxylate transporter substrate binding protein n=1 Tax=Polaromonas sp. YR568 TaxID=1855301 RepID=UPI0008E74E6B|nr:tripartite tricarboxylate transporter substrate binding protein [Polaromonas sp. YR568]SFU85371.1 Tripartite-type tricarboxylate transporter, receptor component TctC [Polaromonas sp. YR568]
MKYLPKALMCLVAVIAAAANAQEAFPNRPITIVVPQQAGSASDVMMRILAQKMSLTMKQSVVIDNRIGAGGSIGASFVAKSKPDGYTLLMNGNSHVINPALYKNANFDPVKDFVPVSLIAEGTLLLVTNPGFPAKNVAELLAQAKASPGKIFYSTPGNGTLNHLATVMFEQAANVSFQHVPYKGAPVSVADVVGGQIPFTFSALASSLPFIQSGKLKVLAATNEARLKSLPQVPTIKETVAGYSVTPWYGLFAPAGTPDAVVNVLHEAVNSALTDPSVVEAFEKQGLTATPQPRTKFAAFVNSEVPVWRKIVKDSGASLD